MSPFQISCVLLTSQCWLLSSCLRCSQYLARNKLAQVVLTACAMNLSMFAACAATNLSFLSRHTSTDECRVDEKW